ncbi:hypothetical protein ATCC53582_00232 [Novacetimonas hansenii]|nr:hypothetical protein ATCC53582_00232 [Novacetimonas hansenii]
MGRIARAGDAACALLTADPLAPIIGPCPIPSPLTVPIRILACGPGR